MPKETKPSDVVLAVPLTENGAAMDAFVKGVQDTEARNAARPGCPRCGARNFQRVEFVTLVGKFDSDNRFHGTDEPLRIEYVCAQCHSRYEKGD